MTMTLAVILACAACFVLKLAGYLVPETLVSGPRAQRITTLLPVALLAALVAIQTFAEGTHLLLDARLIAVAVALILLWRGANFLVVVIAAAAVAALVRLLGWMA